MGASDGWKYPPWSCLLATGCLDPPEPMLVCPPGGPSRGPPPWPQLVGRPVVRTRPGPQHLLQKRGGSLWSLTLASPLFGCGSPHPDEQNPQLPFPSSGWGKGADRGSGGLRGLSSGLNVLEGCCSYLAGESLALLSDELGTSQRGSWGPGQVPGSAASLTPILVPGIDVIA